jgi:hypothetical protein
MFRYRGQFKDASLYTLANVSVALRGDGTGCLGMDRASLVLHTGMFN